MGSFTVSIMYIVIERTIIDEASHGISSVGIADHSFLVECIVNRLVEMWIYRYTDEAFVWPTATISVIPVNNRQSTHVSNWMFRNSNVKHTYMPSSDDPLIIVRNSELRSNAHPLSRQIHIFEFAKCSKSFCQIKHVILWRKAHFHGFIESIPDRQIRYCQFPTIMGKQRLTSQRESELPKDRTDKLKDRTDKLKAIGKL